MKLHKVVKRLLQEGFNHISIKGDLILVYADYALHGDDFKNLHDDFSEQYFLEITTEDEYLIISLSPKTV